MMYLNIAFIIALVIIIAYIIYMEIHFIRVIKPKSADSPHAVLFFLQGQVYKWIGFFDYQLESYEAKRLPVGTAVFVVVRDTMIKLTVWDTRWSVFRYRTRWTVLRKGPAQLTNEKINELKKLLMSTIYE